jgi:hypothetical protein
VHVSIAKGATLQDPTGTIQVDMSISGFVDDTNTCINQWLPQQDATMQSILEKVQHDTQLWNDILFVSGGQLELSKCSFHFLQFDFDPDGTPQISTKIPGNITITDAATGSDINMKALPPHAPHKTLGHWMSPAGNSKTQLTTIREKVQVISTRIATSGLCRNGSRLAYHAIYVAT